MSRTRRVLLQIGLVAWAVHGAWSACAAAPVISYEVTGVYPHDSRAFTQGLVLEAGVLYESTGLHGRSTLRRVALESGKVLRMTRLPARLFGEGVTLYRGRLFQLTWQARTGFVYDKRSLALLERFDYRTEGWGITHDGEHLVISDGSAFLYYLDPQSFYEQGRIQVTDEGRPVRRLNELEYVRGAIYANVWPTSRVARIHPESGEVLGWLELEGLLEEMDAPGAGVANGIAYDPVKDRLLLTGKLWPKLFEVRLIDE